LNNRTLAPFWLPIPGFGKFHALLFSFFIDIPTEPVAFIGFLGGNSGSPALKSFNGSTQKSDCRYSGNVPAGGFFQAAADCHVVKLTSSGAGLPGAF
jgi:hypothetical protein